MKCTKIVVHGEVQGVGFRRYVWSVAKRLGLKGYVKNLSNGRVEIVVQGDIEDIEKLLNKIRSTKIFTIQGIERTLIECNSFDDFEIIGY